MALRKFLLNSGLVLVATITTTFFTATCQIKASDKYPHIFDPYLKDHNRNHTIITYNYSNLPEMIPSHYNVEIRAFFKDNILLGQCGIVIRINRVLRIITLNSIPVNIIKVVLTNSKNIAIESSSQLFINTLTIYLHDAIFPDTYTLNITYIRVIYENNNLYQPVNLDKLAQMLNQTGMVVMKARELFPYMNESVINSTFKIAIKHEKEYQVLSNMPIRARYTANNNRMMWTDFDESLSMSVEHISVVIITFTNVSTYVEDVIIWCRQSAQKYVLYAKNVIENVVPYFKQKYFMEFTKLDIVVFWHLHDYNTATPGFILLREADIIYNEISHPVIRKREVAHMIARQLALLWCGDALLWSKEGFGTFFGAHILDQIVYQNDHVMDLMIVQAQQDSFRYDTPSTIYSSTLNSTNISQFYSLESPSNQMKSFLIWRMIYNIIPDVFWRGIRTYINRHRFHENVTPDYLWTIMQTLYNKTHSKYSSNLEDSSYLKEIITNWITKKYYFVLNVKQHHSLENNTFLGWKISYIQSRYLSLNDKTNIWINVTYISESLRDVNETHRSLWLTTNRTTRLVSYSTSKSNDWFIVNIQQTGYYRVKYELENWQKLTLYLNSESYTEIHILNRAQIIDDAFYFFLQRELSYDLFWNLTRFVTQEANFVTWYPMIKVFESFACIYPLEYGYKITRNMQSRINQLLTKIGYTEEPTDHTLTIYLRQEAVKWACMLGVSECQKVAVLEFNKELQTFVENSNLIGKKWIYCHGLRTANYTIWYEIWQKWNATSDENYLEYLTCSENFEIICNFLNLTLLEKIQPNDSKRATRRANAFLVSVAKHARTDQVNSCLFQTLKEISFSINRKNDIIATLIVIITHTNPTHYKERIIEFVSNYEYPIIEAVVRKRKKRILEYKKLIQNYEYYFFSPDSDVNSEKLK